MSANIFFSFIGVEWLYKALEQYKYITIRSIIFKFVALIAMFFLIHEKEDYIIYGGIAIFAGSASNILNFINVRKYVDLKKIFKSNGVKKHIKPILIFFSMSCATVIYTNLDTVMLGFMLTDSDVGYYSAAVKVKSILVGIITSLGAVLLPRVSYYVKCGQIETFHRVIEKALKFVILLASPLTIYFMIFAGNGIRLLSGKGYEQAIVPMIIIMPTLLLIGMTNIMGIQVLVPMNREKDVLRSVIVGAVVDIIINILLIPKLKSSGASLGTLIAEISVFVVQYIVLKDIFSPIFKNINYKPIITALILASLFSILVLKLNLGNFGTLLVSSICFFGIYDAVLLLAKEPLAVEIQSQIFSKIFNK